MSAYTWHDYTARLNGSPHSVVGTLKLREQIYSPQLGNRRDLLVYLPPSYATSKRRYPVLYMHDGQNLFDHATSYAGEWQVDETMELLGAEGLEAIVVGIPNAGAARLDEYSPFRAADTRGGLGDAYLAFLTQTIKPLVDSDFRTLPDRAHTGIMGSSMGGLISLYALFRHPELFGFAGAMSPAFWFAENAIFAYIFHAPYVPGTIYLDVGTRESIGPPSDRLVMRSFARRFIYSSRRMYKLLLGKGYRPDESICYVEDAGAPHNEAAWAARLPAALRFLLRR